MNALSPSSLFFSISLFSIYPLSISLSLSYTLPVSLSQSLSHFRSLSLLFFISLSLCLCLCLSPSISLIHLLSILFTFSLILYNISFPPSLSLSLPHLLSLSPHLFFYPYFRHPVYSMSITGSGSAVELLTASTDGTLCQWEISRLNEPTSISTLTIPSGDQVRISLYLFDLL